MQPVHLSNTAELPRLLLNFDVNGTLILKDTSKDTGEDHMLVSTLAETTFAKWDDEHEPMSFKQYVYSVLLPGDKSNAQLKKERQKTVGAFLQWLNEHSHPAENAVLENYRRVRDKFTDPKTKEIAFTVFSSFYVMLEKLRQLNIPFTIILRTFGGDLPEVVGEIGAHPAGVNFSRRAAFKDMKFVVEGQGVLEKAGEIFDLFLSSKEHFAVNDDWHTWNHNREKGQSGKPFWYDGTGRDIKSLSLFFDDNITGEEQDIVRPCEISGMPATTKELFGRLIFPVNTMEAMLQDDYYITRVQQALESYAGTA